MPQNYSYILQFPQPPMLFSYFGKISWLIGFYNNKNYWIFAMFGQTASSLIIFTTWHICVMLSKKTGEEGKENERNDDEEDNDKKEEETSTITMWWDGLEEQQYMQ